MSLSLASEPIRTVGTDSSLLRTSFLSPMGAEENSFNRDSRRWLMGLGTLERLRRAEEETVLDV